MSRCQGRSCFLLMDPIKTNSIKTLDKLENVFYVCCSNWKVHIFPCSFSPRQTAHGHNFLFRNYATIQQFNYFPPFVSRKQIPYFTPRYATYQGAARGIATYGGEYSFLLRYAERLPNTESPIPDPQSLIPDYLLTDYLLPDHLITYSLLSSLPDDTINLSPVLAASP